jgi:hypothetical protein
MVDQQLVEQIATAYEGSRHGNSRFMKLMKLHSQEVREAVDQYLATHSSLPQGKAPAPVKTSAPAAHESWEISMPFDELVSIHLSASGVPGSWFVQNFKKLSPTNQARVNARLVEIGHNPYHIPEKGHKTQQQVHFTPKEPKVLSEEQKQTEAALINTLNELRMDQEAILQFAAEIGAVENDIRKQLADLRGVKFDGPLHDPFKASYKSARAHSRHNRAEIESSAKCGCFFCRAVFDPKAIYTYSEGDTAMCPNCGMDSVIGDKAGFELSDEFLVAMFRHWFSIPIKLRSIRPIESIPAHRPAPAISAPSVTDGEPAKEFVVPPHLEEAVPAGIGAALIGSLVDDEEDEDDGVVRTIPIPAAPATLNAEDDEDFDDDDEDDDDWDDEEDDDDEFDDDEEFDDEEDE